MGWEGVGGGIVWTGLSLIQKETTIYSTACDLYSLACVSGTLPEVLQISPLLLVLAVPIKTKLPYIQISLKRSPREYLICSGVPPDVAFVIAHAASFLVRNSAFCKISISTGKMFASMTAWGERIVRSV